MTLLKQKSVQRCFAVTSAMICFKYLWRENYILKSASLSSLLPIQTHKKRIGINILTVVFSIQCGYFLQHPPVILQSEKNWHTKKPHYISNRKAVAKDRSKIMKNEAYKKHTSDLKVHTNPVLS